MDSVSLCLLCFLSFILPDSSRIWSGAASTGIFTIQLAREAGWRVICTASTVHEEYLVGLGATAVIDRDLPAEEQIEQIKSITGGDVRQQH
jgi:NADPH:quinone reductase-like Zn-dependent oxidoreductase